MDIENVKQVVETIKTLNINFNDATTQKIADQIIPVVRMYIIKDYIDMGLTFLFGLVFLIIVLKFFKSIMEN